MATNFGASSTDLGTLESATPVVQGVVKPSPSATSINNIFDNVIDSITLNQKNKAATIVSEFTKQQLLVADALDQGTIPNSAYARSLLRKNLLDAISNHPKLAGEFISAQKSIVDLPGGGDIIKEGDDEEQRWNSRKDDLAKNGYVAPDATEEEFRRADLTQRQLTALTQEHQLRVQTIDEELKNVSLSEAKRKELEGQRKDAAYQFVQKVAPTELTRVKTEFEKIINGPGSATEKQQAIEVFWAQFLSDAQQVSFGLDSDDATLFRKPFEVLKESYTKLASGEYQAEDVKRQIEIATNSQIALSIADPEIARAVAATKLFGENAFLEILIKSDGNVSKKILNFVANGTTTADLSDQPSPYSTKNVDKQALKEYLKGITSSFNSGGESKEESRGRIQRVLDSVEDYEGMLAKDKTGAIELVNWLASPEFAKAVESDPSLKEKTSAAREALRRQYDDEVWGMLNREFLNNKIMVPSFAAETARSDMVSIDPNDFTQETDSVVTIVSDPSGMKFVAIDPKNTTAVAKAKELNKTLKPIINTQIKAWAHLDGRTDYSKYWEESASQFLGTDAGSDAGDDISMDDFLQKGTLSKALASGGYVGDGDFSNAETPADVAASFVGFSEGTERDVLSSFINKVTGGNIDVSSTAWCAGFVNAALGAKNVKGTGSLSARSFLDWGTPTNTPSEGDVVVLWRDDPSSGKGHVGFYVGPSEKEGYIKILGGNQNNKVSIEDYPIKRVLGYRQPVLGNP